MHLHKLILTHHVLVELLILSLLRIEHHLHINVHLWINVHILHWELLILHDHSSWELIHVVHVTHHWLWGWHLIVIIMHSHFWLLVLAVIAKLCISVGVGALVSVLAVTTYNKNKFQN